MKLSLKRNLTLFDATIYGVGIIIGAGIYALIGEAAGVSGNAVWLAFLVGAGISALTGLSYAELSAMYPREAAEYVYVKKAYQSKFLAFIIGWLIIFTGIVSIATVSLGFARILGSLVNIPIFIPALLLIFLTSFINYKGIKESSKLNIFLTAMSVLGLLIVIILGIGKIGSVNYFYSPNGFKGIMTASTLIFFAYIGFEDIVNLSEETKKPKKVIPKALVLAILITASFYVLTSLSAVSLADWRELAASESPLALAASKSLGDYAYVLMSLIAICATAGTVLVINIVTTRMIYGMSIERSLPSIFSRLHKKNRTPIISIIVVFAIASLFIFFQKIAFVASITSLGAFITFTAVNLSLVWLRWRKPKEKRPFKVPLNIGNFPLLSFLGAIFAIFMIYQFDIEVLVIGLFILLAGAIVYKIRKDKIIQKELGIKVSKELQ